MKKIANTLLIITCLFFFSLFSNCNNKKESLISIKTSYGNIKIKLYDETPLHKENFLKLVESNYYDGTLFHRVIKEFMIQAGDPNSKDAPSDIQLGTGGPDYTIPAEFNPALFHKKGALAAARQSDQVNPEKQSSGSQFFIVQGKVYTAEELDKLEQEMINHHFQQYIYTELVLKDSLMIKKIEGLQKDKNIPELNELSMQLTQQAEHYFDSLNLNFKFSEEQREAYTTIGGTPFLDGQYTVFGEVVEGFDIIDKIIDVSTDPFDRPVEDISITVKVL